MQPPSIWPPLDSREGPPTFSNFAGTSSRLAATAPRPIGRRTSPTRTGSARSPLHGSSTLVSSVLASLGSRLRRPDVRRLGPAGAEAHYATGGRDSVRARITFVGTHIAIAAGRAAP